MLGVDLDTVRLVLGLVDVRIELDIDQVDLVRCFELLLDPPWLEAVVVVDVVVATDVIVALDEVLDYIVVLHIVRVVDDLDVLHGIETELIDQVAVVDQLIDLDLVVLGNLVLEQLDIALDPIVIAHHGLLDAIEINIRMDMDTADTIVPVDGDSTSGRHCSKQEMARSIDQRIKVDNRRTVVDDELLEAFDNEAKLLELNQVDNALEVNVLEPDDHTHLIVQMSMLMSSWLNWLMLLF